MSGPRRSPQTGEWRPHLAAASRPPTLGFIMVVPAGLDASSASGGIGSGHLSVRRALVGALLGGILFIARL